MKYVFVWNASLIGSLPFLFEFGNPTCDSLCKVINAAPARGNVLYCAPSSGHMNKVETRKSLENGNARKLKRNSSVLIFKIL